MPRFRFIVEFECPSIGEALRVGSAYEKLTATAEKQGAFTSPKSVTDGPLHGREKSLVDRIRAR